MDPAPLASGSVPGGSSLLEKTSLSIRFIPILCSVPLLYAHAMKIFERHGLSVDLKPAPGWSGIKELLTHGKIDAAHVLSPMPLACAAGIDGMPSRMRLCLIQNVNGQALTLSMRHRGTGENPPNLRGLTFGVPYLYSMQYYLLCHYLAEQGIDPQHDVRIIEVVPPLMPLYLAKGWLDGFFGPEPYPQIAVRRGSGFIYLLSKEIWSGHPCCGLAVSAEFLTHYPNTARALIRSVLEAQHLLHNASAQQRDETAALIIGSQYLNVADPSLITQALVGRFANGAGQMLNVPDYVDFVPYPRLEYAEWILSQMQRWGQLPLDVDRHAIAKEVFHSELVDELAPQSGFSPLASTNPQSLTPTDPQLEVSGQRFAAPRATREALKCYALSPELKLRLTTLLSRLADVAGGNFDTQIEVTAEDEIGWIEQMLSELIRNTKFTQQALREQRLVEAQATQQQLVIATQRELLDELSIPIIPLFSSGLLVPLIGTIDVQRAERLTTNLLEAVTKHRARFVLLDITGISTVDQAVAGHLRQVVQASALLGARCVLIGISPQVAAQFVSLSVDLSGAVIRRDLASALEYFFDQMDLRILAKTSQRLL